MCTNHLQLLMWMTNAKERWCISNPHAMVGIPGVNPSLVMDHWKNRISNVIKLYVHLTYEISLLAMDWCLRCWFHVCLLKRRYSPCEQLCVWVLLRRESAMPRLFVFRLIYGKEGASHVRSSSVVLETMFVENPLDNIKVAAASLENLKGKCERLFISFCLSLRSC